MLSNMAASLILHKRITTTVAKAKALRVYVEPLITRSKTDSTHSRRMVFRQLQNKFAVNELFRDISVKVADRPGGYTRIIKLGNRLGDNAEMCMIELVDFNENLLGSKAPKKAKSTRRRGGSKKAAPASETTATKEVATEKPVAPAAETKAEEAPETKKTEEETKTDEDKAKA
jgi:large subunit ribosomal protein L17